MTLSTTGLTLEQWLIRQSLPTALHTVVIDMATACQQIADKVGKTTKITLVGTENSHGEAQKTLDIESHQLIAATLKKNTAIAAMVSEETESIIDNQHNCDDSSRYLLAFDPLDGSSNIGLNMPVGTIFSVLPCPVGKPVNEDMFLQSGEQQLVAGFCIYGPSTLLILTAGDGVASFMLSATEGVFTLIQSQFIIPPTTTEFAINMSNQYRWQPPIQRYIDECINGLRQPQFNMRWTASMVADVYRLLVRGGIFLYPQDDKHTTQGGRLRLLYEVNPMGWIIEQAGGASSTGKQSVLTVMPQHIHQCVPVILGATEEVRRVESYY